MEVLIKTRVLIGAVGRVFAIAALFVRVAVGQSSADSVAGAVSLASHLGARCT